MVELMPASRATTLSELSPMARFCLRVGEADRDACAAAFGLSLPTRIGEVRAQDERRAACLGPDEWLITLPEGEADDIAEAFASVEAPHSLVETSSRERSFRLEGPSALDALATGCPRDLTRLPVGGAVRTVFAGLTVVIWRDGEADYRIDVGRSFAPHLVHHLELALRELAAEAAV